MWVQKDEKTKKWMVQYTYVDWQGKRRKTTKRGFATKKEAQAWPEKQRLMQQASLDMCFTDFLELYYEDMEKRLRTNTMRTKRYIIDKKVVPYFGHKRMNEIKTADIRRWQNQMIDKGYAATYLKTINNQLSAIFNFAVQYYDLAKNPCTKAGSMGKSHADEKQFWTKDEFEKFVNCIMNKRLSYIAFMTLYWTGVRIGELLALNIEDVDFQRKTISITKSCQRINGEDVITPPKTPKSKRTISIPDFLLADLGDYITSMYDVDIKDRLFPCTKYYLEHEMQRGIKASKVKRIRLHDLRHSHASMLIDLGFSPLAIAERLGHEKIETTLNTYGHLYPNKQAGMAMALEEQYQEEL